MIEYLKSNEIINKIGTFSLFKYIYLKNNFTLPIVVELEMIRKITIFSSTFYELLWIIFITGQNGGIHYFGSPTTKNINVKK